MSCVGRPLGQSQLLTSPLHRFPLTPYRYLIGGLLSNLLGGVQLTCTEQQTQFVTPPAGVANCASYLGEFVSTATGFITNPDASGVPCGYCQYQAGDEYLETVQTRFSERWRSESPYITSLDGYHTDIRINTQTWAFLQAISFSTCL